MTKKGTLAISVEERITFTTDLHVFDAVCHAACNSSFWIGKDLRKTYPGNKTNQSFGLKKTTHFCSWKCLSAKDRISMFEHWRTNYIKWTKWTDGLFSKIIFIWSVHYRMSYTEIAKKFKRWNHYSPNWWSTKCSYF